MVRQHVMAVIILDHCNSSGGENTMQRDIISTLSPSGNGQFEGEENHIPAGQIEGCCKEHIAINRETATSRFIVVGGNGTRTTIFAFRMTSKYTGVSKA
jgi:hypothetical protein